MYHSQIGYNVQKQSLYIHGYFFVFHQKATPLSFISILFIPPASSESFSQCASATREENFTAEGGGEGFEDKRRVEQSRGGRKGKRREGGKGGMLRLPRTLPPRTHGPRGWRRARNHPPPFLIPATGDRPTRGGRTPCPRCTHCRRGRSRRRRSRRRRRRRSRGRRRRRRGRRARMCACAVGAV